MKNLFIVVILAWPSFLVSQNYNVASKVLPAHYNVEAGYYSNAGIKTFAIDSFTAVGSDTLFETFKTFSDSEKIGWEECVDSSGGAIMGRTILQQDSRTVLFNAHLDSIFINKYTNPGNSWSYFSYQNGEYLEANHKETAYQKVLGIYDSVKVIELIRKDSEGNEIEDEINGFKLLLSQNYGLVKTLDHYLFPEYINICVLSGYENPKVGTQNVTARNVYDYQVGDEFHFYRENLHWYFDDEDTLYKIDYGDERWVMRFVTARTDFGDSVRYEYLECSRIFDYANDTFDTLYLSETVFETIVLDNVLPGIIDAYSNQKVKIEELGEVYYEILQSQSSQYNYHPYKSITEAAYMDYDSCIIRSIFDPCCYDETYIAGCGGPYYYWSDWFGTTIERELLYFNKNGDVWGEPLADNCNGLVSDIQLNTHHSNRLSIYPNPFKDQISIKSIDDQTQIVHISIFDIHGKLLEKYDLNASNYSLQTNRLTKGIYVLEIRIKDGSLHRKKVIKN